MKILAHIFGSTIMASSVSKLYGAVKVATMSILGAGQRLIIFFLRAPDITGVLESLVVYWFLVVGISRYY